MPEYQYRCKIGHTFNAFNSVVNHEPIKVCECGALAPQIITAPLLVKAAADVCYDSPIDGSHITSWDKRREDLARNGCREYDPEMRTDYHRNLKDSEAALDKMVDASVEEAIEKMPSSKRARLHSELVDQGVTADVARSTPHA